MTDWTDYPQDYRDACRAVERLTAERDALRDWQRRAARVLAEPCNVCYEPGPRCPRCERIDALLEEVTP